LEVGGSPTRLPSVTRRFLIAVSWRRRSSGSWTTRTSACRLRRASLRFACRLPRAPPMRHRLPRREAAAAVTGSEPASKTAPWGPPTPASEVGEGCYLRVRASGRTCDPTLGGTCAPGGSRTKGTKAADRVGAGRDHLRTRSLRRFHPQWRSQGKH
jgi:hypothetical protein